MRDSRNPSRAVTIAAGSSASSIESGNGCSHRIPGAGSGGASGSSQGRPSPDASARVPRCRSAVRQVLVAMR